MQIKSLFTHFLYNTFFKIMIHKEIDVAQPLKHVKDEIAKVIVGQEDMVDALIIALLCEGHVLLEGVPGLAKTTTVKTLAHAMSLDFKRVQFTPDLLPSDIVGMEIYDPKNSIFKIKHGPIFANLILADEINRAPAKVQSALLEAMQERQVTIGEESFKLPAPFLVMATQNPVESEGAYHLPEAQLDRFMMKVVLGYNTQEEEIAIAKRVNSKEKVNINQVLHVKELEEARESMQNVHMDEEIEKYISDIIFATRELERYGLEDLSAMVSFGASPRGTIDLFKAVKAYAYLKERDYVTPVDVVMIVKQILRHRIVMSYEAEAEGFSSDMLLDKIIETLPLP